MTGLLALLSALVIGCGGKSKSSAAGGNTESQTFEASKPQADTSFEGTGFNYQRTPGLPYDDAVIQESPLLVESSKPGEPLNQAETAVFINRKLIKRAELRIEADQSLIDNEGKISGVSKKIDNLMRKYDAYSEQTWSDENSARYTIRVPQVHYEALITETGALGKVRSRSETAEDVTLKYYDLEGRLTTKKTLLATFQGYLGRAKDIDDVMKVETRIADLQNEIDRLGSQFKMLANQIDYATVELQVYSYRHTSGYSTGDRIGKIFTSFGSFASGALVVLTSIIVYGVPIILFCLLLFWLLFGRVGILKRAFRLVMYGKDTTVKIIEKTGPVDTGDEKE